MFLKKLERKLAVPGRKTVNQGAITMVCKASLQVHFKATWPGHERKLESTEV